MDDLGALALVVLLLDRNKPVHELDETNSPLPRPAFEEVAAVPDVAAAAAVVDVAIGVAVVEEEDDDDDDVGEDEEAAALAPVAPVLGDAVQRLLLYVDLLRFRTELVHALPRLVRDVIQGLFRVI